MLEQLQCEHDEQRQTAFKEAQEARDQIRVRVQLIGLLEPCTTEIYLYIVARMADYMATHPYRC